MIRLACPQDAEQLFQLNQQFNGPSCTTPQAIARSLAENPREIVAVAEEDGVLTGFVCAQLKVSFCYERPTAEITEVFVAEAFRRQGLARAMLRLVQQVCAQSHSVADFTLLTGSDNASAQALYAAEGFRQEDEVLYVKEESPGI